MEVYLSGHRRRIQRGTKVYLLLIIIFGGVIGYYSWDRWQVFKDAQALLAKNEDVKTEILLKKNESEGLYKAAQSDTEGVYEKRQKALRDVFPLNEDLTILTRALDKFFLENNYKTEPLFLESLTFRDFTSKPEDNYVDLPFDITVTGSRRNIEKFLLYIEQSGYSFSKTRLMEINTINLSFTEDENQPEKQLIKMTATLSAYFQKKPS